MVLEFYIFIAKELNEILHDFLKTNFLNNIIIF